MKRISALYLLFVVVCFSCSKEEKNVNPPIVESDYFTADVDGKYWSAGCDHMFNSCLTVRYDSARNILIVDGTDNTSKSIVLALADSSTANGSSGVFALVGKAGSIGHSGNFATYQDRKKSYLYAYYTDSTHQGTMTVTFDKINKRVKGNFSFKAKFETDSDEVNVTSGRFSLSLP